MAPRFGHDAGMVVVKAHLEDELWATWSQAALDDLDSDDLPTTDDDLLG